MKADDVRVPHDVIDLGTLSDQELYALESQRALSPGVLVEVVGEIRRRRRSRSAPLADVQARHAAPAVVATLGDLERVSADAMTELIGRLQAIDRRARSLRWWLVVSPALWTIAGVASLLWWQNMR